MNITDKELKQIPVIETPEIGIAGGFIYFGSNVPKFQFNEGEPEINGVKLFDYNSRLYIGFDNRPNNADVIITNKPIPNFKAYSWSNKNSKDYEGSVERRAAHCPAIVYKFIKSLIPHFHKGYLSYEMSIGINNYSYIRIIFDRFTASSRLSDVDFIDLFPNLELKQKLLNLNYSKVVKVEEKVEKKVEVNTNFFTPGKRYYNTENFIIIDIESIRTDENNIRYLIYNICNTGEGKISIAEDKNTDNWIEIPKTK